MYISETQNDHSPKLRHYLYLLIGIMAILFVDVAMFKRISMVALYTVPLVMVGIYFPRLVAYITGIAVWTMGLLVELDNLTISDITFRYFAIGIMFVAILLVSFRVSSQAHTLRKSNFRLQGLVLNVVQSLSFAIEAKDPYLKGHSRSVANVSKIVAAEMAFPATEVTNIYYAALLHDVGKIGISDSILNKPGRLTENEYSFVKQHSEIGANIVKEIKEFEPFIKYIECHHERWDGLGYPHGLKGEEIPMGARLISVADAFDAMVSERSYRKPLSVEAAIVEIKNGSGKQFDPDVVRAFLNCVDNLSEREDDFLHLFAS